LDSTAEVDAWCRLHYPKVLGTLRLYLGDSSTAEELAQETLIRGLEQWDRLELLDDQAAWLHTVALNLARSWIRRRYAERRALARVGSNRREYEQLDPSAPEIVRALARLPERQRRAIVLRYYAAFSVGQVAEVMSCAESTVKTHLQRAMRALRTDSECFLEEYEL
jgi:RNA polymerase sigma-70 factor (ECF subfamily)